MAAGGRERADIENQVQWFLLPQRMAMGQRMGLAPLPLREVRTEGGLEVGDAGLPRSLDGIGPGFLAKRVAIVPPG